MREVKRLIYKENVIPQSFPTAVLARFDKYNEPIFYNTNLVPTCRVSLASFTDENCERRKVPLELS